MANARKQTRATAPAAKAGATAHKKPKKLKAKTLEERATKLASANAARQAAVDEKAAETQVWLASTMRAIGQSKFPYTSELGAKIHDLLVAGVSVMKISMLDDMPSDVTMFKWIGNPEHPFSKVYKEAKQLMVARFEEEIQAIADEECVGEVSTTRHVVIDNVVTPVTEVRRGDMIEHRKLRIAARQWTLSHLMPKKHGKQAVLTDDKPNEQLNALFAALQAGPAKTDG
jgi:hypothetical protein